MVLARTDQIIQIRTIRAITRHRAGACPAREFRSNAGVAQTRGVPCHSQVAVVPPEATLRRQRASICRRTRLVVQAATRERAAERKKEDQSNPSIKWRAYRYRPFRSTVTPAPASLRRTAARAVALAAAAAAAAVGETRRRQRRRRCPYAHVASVSARRGL